MRLLLYLSLIAGEWAAAYYVRRLSDRSGGSMRELIGGSWATPARVLRDFALAAGLWLAWKLIGLGLDRLPFLDRGSHVGGMLPHGPLEIALWIALSVSAGFCEELVFRGYLLRCLSAWTHSRALGLVLQAVLFGVVHGYQGASACARIACFGVLFGAVALWRRSLRPGMIAHAATDIVAGIFQA
jgi:uncharacterized protein